MATNFPTSVDSFTNPTAVDTLDSPPHDQQHADANDAIEAIETALLDGAPLHIDAANERVGIGDTSPSYTLDVTGDINATGDLRIGGTAIGEWSNFTPTWTSYGTAPSIGNGIIVGRYAVIGKVLIAEYALVFGSTTSGGSGAWFFSYPATIDGPIISYAGIGSGGYAVDASTTQAWTVAVSYSINSGTIHGLRATYAGGFGEVGATLPFSFANGDTLSWGVVARLA